MFYSGRKAVCESAPLPVQSADSVNLYPRDGKSAQRSALVSSYTDELYDAENASATRVIDQRSPVIIDGERCKAYIILRDYDDYTQLSFRAYSQTSKRVYTVANIYAGCTGEYFHCTAFNGAPHRGCGVFLLFSAIVDGKVYLQCIYELNCELTAFVRYNEDEYYAPTVLRHGRGNLFYKAADNIRSSIKEPEDGQPFNLLSGRFCAQYRTDGVSTRFFVPRTPIRTQAIEVTMRGGSGAEYSWTIGAGSQTSDSSQSVVFVDYDEETGAAVTLTKDISLYVLRSSGCIVSYSGSTSNETALPFVEGGLDNLTITAAVEDRRFKSLLECGEFWSVYDKNSAGVSVALFDPDNNKVYFSSPTDPFYFPESNILEFPCNVSSGFSSHVCGDTVFCVFSDAVYAVNGIKSYRSGGVTAYNTLNIIRTEARIKKGCERSACVCGSRLYYLSFDGHICSVSPNGYDIRRESEKNLDSAEGAWSVLYDGKYLLICGTRGIFADDRLGEFELSGLSECPEPCMSGSAVIRFGERIIAAADFRNGQEAAFSSGGTVSSADIKHSFILTDESFGNRDKKSFYKLRLCFESESIPEEPCVLTLKDERGDTLARSVYLCADSYVLREIYFRIRSRTLSVEMTLPDGVMLSGGKIYYTK